MIAEVRMYLYCHLYVDGFENMIYDCVGKFHCDNKNLRYKSVRYDGDEEQQYELKILIQPATERSYQNVVL